MRQKSRCVEILENGDNDGRFVAVTIAYTAPASKEKGLSMQENAKPENLENSSSIFLHRESPILATTVVGSGGATVGENPCGLDACSC